MGSSCIYTMFFTRKGSYLLVFRMMVMGVNLFLERTASGSVGDLIVIEQAMMHSKNMFFYKFGSNV